eukprot:scaffold2353_cov167-Amphora_coffeaeformis.AAC.60
MENTTKNHHPEQVVLVQAQHVVVALPPTTETGLTFAGGWDHKQPQHQSPLYVRGCNSSPDYVGLYVDSIQFTDIRLMIRQIQSAADFHRALRQTAHLPKRELILSTTPPPPPATHLDARLKSCLIYQYDISCQEPAHQHFTLEGFPPQIRSLKPTSLLNAILRPGLYVMALQVPQLSDFNSTSAGFTGFAVHERMQNTANIPGRSLLFVEENPFPCKPRKKTPWFDLGGFFK